MTEEVVIVTDEDGSENKMELPLNDDGRLSLSTLCSAFPGAVGLKYRNPDTGAFRMLKLDETGVISPPSGGFGSLTFLANFPPKTSENSKRKMASGPEDERDGMGEGGGGWGLSGPGVGSGAKQKRVDNRKCSDLIVLGIPYKMTEDELKAYFDQFGTVLVSQVKRDFKTGKSKGFGFVRFEDYEHQQKVLSQRHHIEGRWCDVKVPDSKKDKEEQQSQSRKVFVGRVPETMSAETLKDYFSTKGEVTDVFIPKPFRSFAFVTFVSGEVAQSLCGEDHIIDGASVYVSQAVPKDGEGKPIKDGGTTPVPDLPPTHTGVVRLGGRGVTHGHYARPPPGAYPPPPPTYPPQHPPPPPHAHWSTDAGAAAGWGSAPVSAYAAHPPPPPPSTWSYPPPPPPSRAPAPPNPIGAPANNSYTTDSYNTNGSSPSTALTPAQQFLQTQSPLGNATPNGGQNSNSAALATQGIGALNLNSLITPQAIQAAISTALAGLVQGGGQQGGPTGGSGHTSADLAALLGNLQSSGNLGSLNSIVSSIAASNGGGGGGAGTGSGNRTAGGVESWWTPATSGAAGGQSIASAVTAAAQQAAAQQAASANKDDGQALGQGNSAWRDDETSAWR